MWLERLITTPMRWREVRLVRRRKKKWEDGSCAPRSGGGHRRGHDFEGRGQHSSNLVEKGFDEG